MLLNQFLGYKRAKCREDISSDNFTGRSQAPSPLYNAVISPYKSLEGRSIEEKLILRERGPALFGRENIEPVERRSMRCGIPKRVCNIT